MASQRSGYLEQTQSHATESASMSELFVFLSKEAVVEAGTTVIVIALIIILIRSLTALVKASKP